MDMKVCRMICTSKNDLEGGVKDVNQRLAKTMFKIALYEYINPKRCIKEYKFNKEKFDIVANDIIESFNKAIVEPGQMVGVEAAQSLGEPSTKSCLKAFYNYKGVHWNDMQPSERIIIMD